ncbi:MAG: TIGR03618 family F420-dependent PPOX class oxidoreductase [Deltaproteobacteria bacterium]|nr:TIGR03618 family F420-dependent PPOX class oxidoreductase [Deltaproteobacteria bacterium]
MTQTSIHMSREQIDTFLAAPRHAVIAAGQADGRPLLSPVWYVFEESRFYFSTLVQAAKCRHLRQDPRIAICVDGAHPDARFVSLYGTAEIVEEDSSWRDELEWRILRRYHESDEAARRYEAELEGDGPSALVVVSPERIVGRDYN